MLTSIANRKRKLSTQVYPPSNRWMSGKQNKKKMEKMWDARKIIPNYSNYISAGRFHMHNIKSK